MRNVILQKIPLNVFVTLVSLETVVSANHLNHPVVAPFAHLMHTALKIDAVAVLVAIRWLMVFANRLVFVNCSTVPKILAAARRLAVFATLATNFQNILLL